MLALSSFNVYRQIFNINKHSVIRDTSVKITLNSFLLCSRPEIKEGSALDYKRSSLQKGNFSLD